MSQSQLELAWAAGFLDGEGSLHKHYSNGKRSKPYLRLAVHQVRPEPLERFAAAVGHGNVTGPYPTKHQPRYQLHYTGAPAEAVWELLEPYVTAPTREKYQRAKEEYQPVAA